MDPFDFSQEQKEELLLKREAIRARLKKEGQDTITLEEQKVFIDCRRALATEKFTLAQKAATEKKSKKKKEVSEVDLFSDDEPIKEKKARTPKAKKPTKVELRARLGELAFKKAMEGLSEEEETEFQALDLQFNPKVIL